jgi:hypothetical protein
MVIAENETTIIIFSKKRRGLDVLCPQGKRSRIEIKGVDFINIDPGCMVSNEDFVTRRSRTQNMEEQRIVVVPWANETIASWAEVLKEDKRREEILKKDLEEINTYAKEKPKEESMENVPPWIETMPTYVWGLIAATSVLAITLVALLAFLCWRFNQASPQD